MDENLKKIIPFALKYKKDIVMNVIYNILYALFSTLSFIALIPIIGAIWLLILFFTDSQVGSNKWGENPKEVAAN